MRKMCKCVNFDNVLTSECFKTFSGQIDNFTTSVLSHPSPTWQLSTVQQHRLALCSMRELQSLRIDLATAPCACFHFKKASIVELLSRTARTCLDLYTLKKNHHFAARFCFCVVCLFLLCKHSYTYVYKSSALCPNAGPTCKNALSLVVVWRLVVRVFMCPFQRNINISSSLYSVVDQFVLGHHPSSTRARKTV